MQAFTKLTGLVAPLDRVNVDTDQIIPKQFLKRIERTGQARDDRLQDPSPRSEGLRELRFEEE